MDPDAGVSEAAASRPALGGELLAAATAGDIDVATSGAVCCTCAGAAAPSGVLAARKLHATSGTTNAALTK